MKIFLDTAHLTSIKKWASSGLVNGVTTNPSHLSKESGNITELVMEICNAMPTGEISVEITEQTPERVYEQAKQIAQLAKNVVVKIPCHSDYYPVIQKLVSDNIPVNVTLVFSILQGLMMCKLGVRYVSLFVGRWDDIDVDGAALLYDMKTMIRRYNFTTQLLAASIRDFRHLHCAIQAGVDAATISPALLEKAITNQLTENGIDLFNRDWEKTGIKQFP